MKATLHLSRRATYADYLAMEQVSDRRHEYIDGVIVGMAGGPDEHNAISGRFAMLLGMRLTGRCRYYSPDQRFWIAASDHGRYSDGSIICGSPEHPVHDDQATTNPVVVVEVLSPSSEGDDEGAKRRDFQSLSSLQAYVLVAQDVRRVTVYRREGRPDAASGWPADPDVYRDGQVFDVPTLSRSITVAEVYAGILDAAGRSLLH